MVSSRLADGDASLLRRLRLADAWRHRLNATLVARGRRRGVWLSRVPYLAGNLALDLLEALRTRRRPPHFGHAHLAALEAPVRLSQDPRYRGYWYDPGRHALVGVQLGLDLNRHRGRYHLIESNIAAAMKPERRQLYDADLDPAVSELVALAAAHRFERLVLLRRWWTEVQLEEFEQAARGTGVEVVGATMAAKRTGEHPRVNPMIALPERLLPRTMHVVFSPFNAETPLFHFLHDKTWTARRLAEAMVDLEHSASRLASIPMFDRIVLPTEQPDGRWPNLVAKLADGDDAKAVATGRFTTEG
jgi:hypothetical protein